MGIDHSICFRQNLTAILRPDHFVVICHDDGHAKLFGQTHLFQSRNAVIAGNDGVNPVFLCLADNGFVDAVAIPDTLRDLVVHMAATPA